MDLEQELEPLLLEDLRLSAERNESLRAWWDGKHQLNHSWWLSGSPPQGIWDLLGIDHLLVPGAEVLEIGVGMGNGPKALLDRGCHVSVLDISSVAIAKVAEFAQGYLADDLSALTSPPALPLNCFDVALSHLVAQHMTDEDLTAQIHAVVRALKPTGLFALHFPSYVNPAQPFDETLRMAKGGGVCRSPERMEELAQAAGAKVSCVRREIYKHRDVVYLNAIHLTRKESQ